MGSIAFMLLLVLVLVLMRIKPCRPQDDHQDSNYHFTKLKEKIDEIKRSPEVASPHHVAKRAAGRKRRVHQADDLLLNSLASFCLSFNTDPDIATYMETKARRQPLSSRDIGGYTRYLPPVHLPSGTWDFGAFPVSILAQRNWRNVWIVFNVVHSNTARVSRLDFDDFQEIVLEFPESACQKIVSKARFVLPIHCDKSDHFKIDLGGNTNAIYLHVDACKLTSTKKNGIVTKKFGIPFFGLETPSTTDKFDKYIFLENDNENGTSFDIELSLKKRTVLEVSLILWDWKTKETLQSTANVSFTSGIVQAVEYNKASAFDKKRQLFTVESLDSCSAVSLGEKKAFSIGKACVRLRTNIDAMPGRSVSGKITFLEHSQQLMKQSDGVVTAVEVTVSLVRPEWRQKSLPGDFIYFSDITRFRCSPDTGNMDLKSTGGNTNCVVKCQAYGEDISLIYITKQTPSKLERRFKVGSYVLPNSATAVLDVGRAEDDLDGDYECTVVNKRGQVKKQSIKLYTKLFTKITEIDLSSDAEMAKITCEVHGDQNVKISISVSDKNRENEKLFNVSNYSTNFQESESGKGLFIVIPWKELKFPRETVHCTAEGNRGADENLKDITVYDQNKLGVLPIVNRTSMQVKVLRNGSVTMKCSVSGARPLRIFMSLMGKWASFEGELVVLRQTVTTGDGEDEAVVKRVLSKSDEGYEWSDLYVSHFNCWGENIHGTDRREYRDAFYLNMQ